MPPPFLPLWSFALAAALPGVLVALAVLAGGPWVLAALIFITLLTAILDTAIPLVVGDAPDGREFPGADSVLAGLALGVLAVLVLVAPVIAGTTDHTPGQRLALFLAAGLYAGQVGHPVAHELIHRGHRGLFLLGNALYSAILMGHHVSAHRLVHHTHVGTRADPNTPRPGEGYYRFALRAWPQGFLAGLRAENALRARTAGASGLHPYALHLGLSALALGTGWVLAGGAGLLAWAALGGFAASQILISDYVQHYGLHRRLLPSGKPEPVTPRLSWNTAHWFTSAMMVNAPRHSDHHLHPSRPYPALRLPAPDEAPRLPWPLPVASTLALVPPLWRRLIAPYLHRWRSRQPMP